MSREVWKGEERGSVGSGHVETARRPAAGRVGGAARRGAARNRRSNKDQRRSSACTASKFKS